MNETGSAATAPRKIGINLLWLVPGIVGGSEDYTVRLLDQLADQLPADLDLTLFALRSFVDAYPDIATRFETVVAPLDGRAKPVRVLAEGTWLAEHVRRRQLDFVHHAGGTLPVIRTAPSIVTIFDLQPLVFPHYFSPAKRAYLRSRLPVAVRRAQLVLTISEASRRSIAETLGADPDRIVVVSPGYRPRPQADDRVGGAAVAVGSGPSEPDFDGPYFIYPAITYPHKNHLLLVQAFADVVAQRPDALLVLTGSQGQMEAAVATEAQRLGISHRVRRVGRIARSEVDSLIRNARALTFPSRFEGFGLPVLEAMAEGTPVVASAASALPEVVGDAGYLLSPDDPAEWSRAMVRLLDDDAERERLVQAGRARAATFTWDAAREKLVEAYRKVTL